MLHVLRAYVGISYCKTGKVYKFPSSRPGSRIKYQSPSWSCSMAQAIMSLPPTNLIISLHLKRVQFKILLWKAADQIFSNSPGKPTPSVFSALTFCPCRQCRTLCHSGWIVCVGSKAAVNILCPHILRMWHLLIGQYRPTSPSGWRDHPVDHSAMPSRPATQIYPCHHRGP